MKTALYCRAAYNEVSRFAQPSTRNESLTACGSYKNEVQIQKQCKLLLDYISENEIFDYQLYIDNGYGGLDFDRPDFERMMNDIKNFEIGEIIVENISRISRNSTDYYKWLKFVNKICISVLSLS